MTKMPLFLIPRVILWFSCRAAFFIISALVLFLLLILLHPLLFILFPLVRNPHPLLSTCVTVVKMMIVKIATKRIEDFMFIINSCKKREIGHEHEILKKGNKVNPKKVHGSRWNAEVSGRLGTSQSLSPQNTSRGKLVTSSISSHV